MIEYILTVERKSAETTTHRMLATSFHVALMIVAASIGDVSYKDDIIGVTVRPAVQS